MKKIALIAMALASLMFVSCQKEKNPPINFNVTITCEGATLTAEGIKVTFTKAGVDYTSTTDATGKAVFNLPAGDYTWTAAGTILSDGKKNIYSGSSTAPAVVAAGVNTISISVNKVIASQLIIKELYCTGCPKADASGTYSDDAYVTIYNNSGTDADASDLVFALVAPSNGHATNGYVTNGVLMYESLDWIPAYSAIWWFKSAVTIPAYSEITVAIFGAIDHTQTHPKSVDLSKANYFWMSNTDIATIFKMAKYKTSENIPANNYLTCSPISMGTAWVISNTSPAFYIGKMTPADAEALSKDSANYDHTLGTSAAFNVAKFPQAKVLDAIDIFDSANLEKSNHRFPAKINSGHFVNTKGQGYTIYRNVDKDATLAIEGNADLIVYNYAGGVDTNTDPSGIDAEASIAKGAKIIYMDTNNSASDFHQRAVAAIKK